MIEIELHNLALNIKEFRKKNKLSQAELAEKLGVARTTIGYYERAEVEPNIYTLVQLSKLMNRSIDSLLGLNHLNETKNDLNNSDLSKKIFILNKLIEKNTQSFNDLETSKLRTERMFNELKRTRNRAENDIKLFQELSKEFTNTLDKEHEINLSDALEYQDINYNFSTTEKEDFLSFGKQLGGSDRKTQIAQMEIYMKELEYDIEKLHMEVQEKKKLYRNMGILGGFFLVIILW